MRTARTLSLKKETLTELTPAELAGVAGASTTVVSFEVCELISRLFVTCPTIHTC